MPGSESAQAPRQVCERCFRPRSVCFCADLKPVATKTRVVILQHPRERDVGIGTARLARLGLAACELRRDVDFSDDPVVRQVLTSGNAYLLFPGPDAIDVETADFPSPITLVVLDGTWTQAQKLLKGNPGLAALPRLRLSPLAPSLYGQIRREPAAHCVATIEAIAHVLGYLEKDRQRFAEFLRPMAAMVERQLYFVTEVTSNRHRHSIIKRTPRDPIPAELRQRQADIVCVQGESNAWPRLHPDRSPPETVHWLAKRLSTGESFEAVIAPRRRLAPSTCHHIQLSPEALAAGESWDTFLARFRAFLRPTDVLVYWGHFSLATLIADGYGVVHPHLDARLVASKVLARRAGTVEDCLVQMDLGAPPPWAAGRGGARIAGLCAVTEKLCAWPAAKSED
ncbi:MAG TPA: tRNA-uridine aminocarboxypropyltransferase [Polyangia bacterium]